jgi:type II secretory pathway component PulC
MRSAILVTLFAFAFGCGHSEPPAATADTAKMQPAAAGPEVREAPPSASLKRSEVRAAVKSGMGALLQRVIVDTEKPVFRQGKFLGFRITQMPREWGADLKPGDVVTHVNGFSVERPESAYEALQSLEVASELRVDYERNGEPRSIRYSIVDD